MSFRLGEKQTLTVVKKVEFGVYLAESRESMDERVLLPAKQVPVGCEIDDDIEVFLYKDSGDRLIATVREPKIMMNQVARLKVVQVGKIGAFLDWGLEKDLLLPFKQQTVRVRENDEVLVSLYIDKSERLCATMNVYTSLSCHSPYKENDMVRGTVYQISDNFGAFVAVDDKYSGLIPKRELYGNVSIGREVNARVTAVREDGKLTLGIRQKAYLQMEEDAVRVLEIIDSYEGVLPFNDRVSPEIIKRETGMSKNEFKRAVGNLLKDRKIEIDGKVIRRKDTK